MIYVRPVGGRKETLEMKGTIPTKEIGVTRQTLTLTAPLNFYPQIMAFSALNMTDT